MKRNQTIASQRPSRFFVQSSQRHNRMREGSRGWVRFRPRPAPIFGSRRLKGQKKLWLRPLGMSRYLRCTRRHLYWLMRNRRFPYYLTGSVNSPRYVFKVREVNIWLSGYRGKGRQLRLRRLGFGKNPERLWFNQKGIWNRHRTS